MTAEVRRFGSRDELATGVAQALVAKLEEVQAERRPHLVLTGGSVADAVHSATAASPGAVRWEDVEIWFGDERYVPRDDDDRNALHARATLLDKVPVDPARVHEMPSPDGEHGDDVDVAALAYGATLLAQAPAEGPWFDVLMLGVGADGHCASLFPERPEVLDPAPVIGVRKSPKPPPTRISMGMTTLQRAREVWFVVSGAEKAEAVAAAVAGRDALDVPAGGPRGSERTLWFLDEAAAWML